MEQDEINPDKYVDCTIYNFTPGGSEACKVCSREQQFACFYRHSEEYSKQKGLLPNENK